MKQPEPGEEGDGTPIRVTDAHLAAALDQLLDTRNELTRVLLGGQAAQAGAPRAGDGGTAEAAGPSGRAGQVGQQGRGDLTGLGDVGQVGAAPDHPEAGPADG